MWARTVTRCCCLCLHAPGSVYRVPLRERLKHDVAVTVSCQIGLLHLLDFFGTLTVFSQRGSCTKIAKIKLTAQWDC